MDLRRAAPYTSPAPLASRLRRDGGPSEGIARIELMSFAARWIAAAMTQDAYPDSLIRAILETTKTIALVGASANPIRPSHGVLGFLLAAGYRVFPVNPGLAGKDLLGARVYARLSDISEAIDMIDIFRNSDAAAQVVDEALTLQPLPRTIWMQLGVRNEPATARARARGVTVIQNRCPKIEFARLSIVRPPQSAGEDNGQRAPRS